MCFRALVCLGVAAVCAGTIHAQGAVEYGAITSGTSSMAASISGVRPRFPTSILPDSGNSNPQPNNIPSAKIAIFDFEVEADVNRMYFLTHAGTTPAVLSVHGVPDRAQVWIDGKFVGSTPLQLKVSRAKHQLLVRAANREDHAEGIDLSAMHTRSIEVSLKPIYKNEIYLNWPK
jgi:PEGA domain